MDSLVWAPIGSTNGRGGETPGEGLIGRWWSEVGTFIPLAFFLSASLD